VILKETQTYLERLTGDSVGENAALLAQLDHDRMAAHTLTIATLGPQVAPLLTPRQGGCANHAGFLPFPATIA